MKVSELKLVKEEDVDNLKMLMAVVNSGNFEIKGEAIVKVASLFNWLHSLQATLEDTLKRQALSGAKKESIKEMK